MRYKLTLEYDGTPFCGWQYQKDCLSVQEVLEQALAVINGTAVTTYAAGRTDSGVHAYHQIVHCDLLKEWSCYQLMMALNAHIRSHPVAIIDCEIVDAHFHARFSAKQKTYLYKIINRIPHLTLTENRAWHVIKPLDIKKMQLGAQFLLGKHDFSSFRNSHCQAKTAIRTLEAVDIAQYEPETIHCMFKAQSFLHHQVRNMVGTLVDVGLHKIPPEYVKTILEAKDRTKAGPTAPACGLYLMYIDYAAKKAGS